VFAIAITLLVLDLAVPESAFHDLWHGIGHEWPGYLGYATSFLTIGAIWLGHHGIFRRLRYANGPVIRINLLLLMAVAFLPFPTRLVAEAIRNSDAERAAVVFYGISLFVTSALISALWGAIARPQAPRAGSQRSGDQRGHARGNAEHCGLPRRHRARDRRSQGGGIRLPGDSGHRGFRARGEEAIGTEPTEDAS